MALSRGKINPLNTLDQRCLKFIPEHFNKISVNRSADIKLIEQWINYNLNSRYAIKRTYIVDQTNKLLEIYEIGIEDPKEITLLTLGCPYIHTTRGELF